MEYYDIEDILAEEECIKVAFEWPISTFGFYISRVTTVIRSNTPVCLPVFMLGFLIKNKHCRIIESQVEQRRDALEAEPSAVDLSGSYFFRSLGRFEDSDWLARIFLMRAGRYLRNIVGEICAEEDLLLLSADEKEHFLASRATFQEFQRYLFRN